MVLLSGSLNGADVEHLLLSRIGEALVNQGEHSKNDQDNSKRLHRLLLDWHNVRSGTHGYFLNIFLGSAQQMTNQGDQKQDKKKIKQNLGDSSGSHCNASEPEKSSNQSNQEKT